MLSFFKKGPLSWYIFLPCLWILNTKTRFLSSWDPYAAANITFDQIKYLSFFFLGLYCLWNRRIDWKIIIKENIILLLFLIYMAISITWSDYPDTAIKRYFKTIGMMVMILVIITDKNPLRAISFVLTKTYALAVVISVVLIFFFPYYGIWRGEWIGISNDKNGLGQIFCMASIIFLWKILTPERKKNLLEVACFSIAFFFLFFGIQSTTAIVVFLLASSTLIFFTQKISTEYIVGLLLLSLTIAGLTYLFWANVSLENPIVTFVKFLGKDMTFTGRDELWVDVLKLAKKRPWLGYGYDSVWIGDVMGLWEFHGWNPNQAHSGYIDTYFTLGIVGLIFLFSTITFSFLNIAFQFPISYNISRIRIAILFAILLFNKTESSFVTSYQDLWLLFLLVTTNRNELINIHIDDDQAK